MGKSKHKDRFQRAQKAVNENEERRKMRESILKIFHERAQSPEGAVLVKDAVTNTCAQSSSWESTGKSSHYKNKQVANPSPPDSQPESQQGTPKHKRYKRIKSRKQCHKAPINQHVQTAWLLSQVEGKDCSHRVDSARHITRNRLTRGVGLFNPGKKSKTIYREPLPVPESVQREVDKTLKHILTADDDVEIWSHANASGSNSACTKKVHGLDSQSTSRGTALGTASHQYSSIGKNFGHSSDSACSGNSSASNPQLEACSRQSSSQASQHFPKAVPYHDIASSLQSFLHTQGNKTFKGRDLLAETCQELKQLLRESQSVLETSCSGAGPASVPDTRSRDIETPVGLADRGSAGSFKQQTLMSNQGTCSAPFLPASAQIISSSAHQPSYPTSQPHLMRLAGEEHHMAEHFLKSHQPFRLHLQNKFNHSPHMPVVSSASSNCRNVNGNLSTSDSLSTRYSQRFAGREQEEGHQTAGCSSSVQRRDDCDIELDFQLLDRSQGMFMNDSAMQIFRCNDFLTKVSSLCGDTEVSPEVISQCQLGSQSQDSSSAAFLAYTGDDSTGAAKDNQSAAVLMRGGVSEDSGNALFVRKVMERSSQYPSPQRAFKFRSHHHQQIQNEVGMPGFEDCFTARWSFPDTTHGDLEQRSADFRGRAAHTIRTVRSHIPDPCAIAAGPAFSSDPKLDFLDQVDSIGKHSCQRSDWLDQWSGTEDTDYNGFACDRHGWLRSQDILPPLKKPSLDSPSPPQKLSPHKWC